MSERSYRQSAVREFKQCRRKWDLGYRQNLELKYQKQSVANVGTNVHTGLQAYYERKDVVQAMNDARVLDVMKASPENAVDVAKNHDLAKIMVDGYMEWIEDEGLDQGWKVLAVEEQLSYPIGDILGDNVTLTGQLDLLIQDGNGDTYVVDDKTCATFETYTFNIQMAEQLLFYDMLVRKVKDLTPAGSVFNMIRRVKRTAAAKPPFFAREVVRFNSVQRRNYENQVLGIVRGMVAAEQAVELDPALHQQEMYPNPNADCSWRCPFLSVCSMRDTGEAFDDAIADMYQQRPVQTEDQNA